MTRRTDIPELRDHASVGVGVAMARGVGEASLRHRALVRPFWGVRSEEEARDHRERCAQYAPRLRPGQAFAMRSAAMLHGLPLPIATAPGAADDVELVVPTGAYRPMATGVETSSLDPGRLEVTRIDGLPVTTPVVTWLLLARELDVDALIVMADALVTTADNYPGLRGATPLASLDTLHAASDAWRRMPGCGKARAALDEACLGVESPMETPTRLVLTRHGIPGVEVQGEVWHDGVLLARCDLVLREWKIAVEFDGDGHRTQRAQWQRDIDRDASLREAGWIVIHVTADMLTRPEALANRIRAAIASR